MKPSVFLPALLLLLVPVLSFAQAPQQTSRHEDGLHRHPIRAYALTGGKVITKPGSEPKELTIIVRESKIETLAKDAKIPADAKVVELEGKFVYPGFIDSYAEVALDQADNRPATAYWNDNIRADFDVTTVLTKDQIGGNDLRKQGFVARMIAPRDGIVRGQTALYSLDGGTLPNSLLVERYALAMELTLARRRGRGIYPNSPMGAVALSRQAFYDAKWYREAMQAVQKNPDLLLPESNVTLAAMQPYATGKAPVMIETSNEQFLMRADDFAQEFDLDLIVIGSGREYRRLADVVKTNRPIVVPVAFPKAPNVATPEAAADASLESLMHWDHAPENLARLAEQEVEIMLTTYRLESTGQFLKNLRTAVERGFNEEAALAALTTVPAKQFGVQDQLGTIEAGKLASFVILEKPLFEKDAEVTETWVNGERFEHQSELPEAIAGDWKLELEGAPKDAEKLLLVNIKGDKNLKGFVRPGETTPKFKDKKELKDLKLEDGRVIATFISDDFGAKGVATLSILYEEDVETLHGTIRWPEGTVSSVKMSASGMEEAENEEEKKKEEEPTKEEEKEKKDEKKVVMASYPIQYPLGSFGLETTPKQEALVAFKGATVWTCGPQGKLENGIVLVKKGKIEAVGADLEIPEDAVVVDATGMHITPGLIDCHSHIATDGGINESGQAITAEVRIGDFIDANDIDIYWQLAGGLTTANVLHGSANPIGGQNQVIKMRWGANFDELKFKGAPLGIKFALGENVKQSNWGENYTTRYPQTRMGVEQVFRDEFQEAQEYAAAKKAAAKAKSGLPVRVDLQMEAISEIVEKKRWIHCHSYRQDEILALLRVLDDFGIKIGSLQHILEGYKVADAMAEHGATASTFADWWAYKVEVDDAIPYNGAMMHDQGIVVSFNSDDAEMGRRMNQEAVKAVKYGGMSEEEALKFVTLNAAIQLRIEDRIGSLEAGKDADLTIWSGAPLSNLSVCKQTWIDGRKYFDKDDEQAQRDRFADMKNKLVQKILDTRAPMMNHGESVDDPTSLWPRHDEFCGHHEHEHEHEHHHE
ncbi:amidohydrolase family protein [Bremerella sp. JC817]|uniref:amidohydrolase family protein n=1 Tax=Bremerella sp. JC817 TaxID=3231756 RepID=UPI00345896CB